MCEKEPPCHSEKKFMLTVILASGCFPPRKITRSHQRRQTGSSITALNFSPTSPRFFGRTTNTIHRGGGGLANKFPPSCPSLQEHDCRNTAHIPWMSWPTVAQ